MKKEIKKVSARKILDSRGNWTVEVKLETSFGEFLASVPSGASKGKHEAKTLKVEEAVKTINKIIGSRLKKENVLNQEKIDKFLNPQKFGSNVTLPVSLAVCRAGAKAKDMPLFFYIRELFGRGKRSFRMPLPAFNIINGGVHAGNDLDFQEFMVVFQKRSFLKNLELAVKFYRKLKEIISQKYSLLATNLGDEGGFAPPLKKPEEALDLIKKTANLLNCQRELKIILDVASSQFYKKNVYRTKMGSFKREGLADYYFNLIKRYPILGIEDPFAEDDWLGWKEFKVKLKKQKAKVLIIGDDLLATNPERMKTAKLKGACDGAIIKMNQIGTISKTIEAAKLAKSFGWKIIVSHRSGETTDDFISDLAVGIGADFIKAGAPARGERVVKYNRLLEIENELEKLL